MEKGYGSTVFTVPNSQIDLDRHLSQIKSLGKIQQIKRKTFEILVQNATEPIRILDIGCGNGSDVLDLAKMVPKGSEIFGIDQNESLIELAKKSLADLALNNDVRVEFIKMMAEEMTFEDNYFDGVRTDRVLLHVKDVEAVLNQAKRVLKQGGTICLCETNSESNVIYTQDEEVKKTYAVFKEYGKKLVNNSAIGTETPKMLMKLGFKDVRLDTEHMLISSPQSIDPGLVKQKVVLDLIVKDGGLTEEMVNNYINRIISQDDGWNFMATGIFFIAVATKS